MLVVVAGIKLNFAPQLYNRLSFQIHMSLFISIDLLCRSIFIYIDLFTFRNQAQFCGATLPTPALGCRLHPWPTHGSRDQTQFVKTKGRHLMMIGMRIAD